MSDAKNPSRRSSQLTPYVRVVGAAIASTPFERRKAYLVEVEHDVGCLKPEGGACSCTPSCTIRELTP